VVLCKNISSRIAWRWPNSVAETCSYKYNKTPVKIVLVVLTLYTHIVYIYDFLVLYMVQRVIAHTCSLYGAFVTVLLCITLLYRHIRAVQCQNLNIAALSTILVDVKSLIWLVRWWARKNFAISLFVRSGTVTCCAVRGSVARVREVWTVKAPLQVVGLRLHGFWLFTRWLWPEQMKHIWTLIQQQPHTGKCAFQWEETKARYHKKTSCVDLWSCGMWCHAFW
jgi:hypothetical protein